MSNLLEKIFSTGSYIPHGHCYLWQSELVWLHIVSDSLIALAYYSIPLTLVYFVYKRKDLPFDWIFLLFGVFIVSCGTTHLMSVWTLWYPTYWLSGILKAITALISIYTAITLVELMPLALALPSPAQLTVINQNLEQEIRDRQQAEEKVRELNRDLEAKVAQRTAELEQAIELVRQRNQDLDRFAYIVSHDLKAPLRAIANLSQWIEEDLADQIPQETQHNLHLLRSRVFRMEALISGLLTYARSAYQEVSITEFSLNDLLLEILDSLNVPPGFTVKIPSNSLTLKTSRLMLSQVFTNLISNALKHHDHPDGEIKITAEADNQGYRFSVSDNGPGIAPEFQDRIFELFQTVNGHNHQESTGIGLAIIKKIIERIGGQMELQSALGKGTTFNLTWPICLTSTLNHYQGAGKTPELAI